MKHTECRSFTELVNKVQKQEEIISQLVKIIAATNHRVTQLTSIVQEDDHYSSHTRFFHS